METPLKESNQLENTIMEINGSDCQKIKPGSGTPDRLKVPKACKYPERYTSPTDHMISPISRGLLARSRKPGMLLPPQHILPKMQDAQNQDTRPIQL
ncbi:hypothetical protein Ancab_018343 [Ancistrocladus abbreviatus]